MRSLGINKRTAGVVLSVLLMTTSYARAAVTFTGPSGSALSSDTVTFTWSTDDSSIRGWHVFVGQYSGSSEYYNSQTTGELIAPSVQVSGLPTDGSPVELLIYEVNDAGNWLGPYGRSYTASTGGGGTTGGDDGGTTDPGNETGGGQTGGTVTLAPGATVQLAPDTAISIDSGLTPEQFSEVATAILLTLAGAIGVRQVLKVLT